LREIATFITTLNTLEVKNNDFYLKTLLHCSRLGNDCPIRIVEGEAATKYKGRVLGHWLYNYTDIRGLLYDV
jgi:hypothetical protein